MVSILIPTYNYDVRPLIAALRNEINQDSKFEIIITDDGSSIPEIRSANAEIEEMEGITFLQNEKNIGRTATRQRLAKMAKFPWLLFLDADVLPMKKDFLKNYFEAINEENDLIFGGITYEEKKPETSKMLRWKYGMERENLPLKLRKNRPILSINSGAFLIKKSLFLKINTQWTANNYGLDILFKQLLIKNNARVRHIGNPVYHLGLESNESFLKKSLQAIETMVVLEKKDLIPSDYTALQNSYLKLKKLGLTSVFKSLVSGFERQIEKNLNSEKPNLRLFDLYKLNHYITLKQKSDA